MTKQSHSLQLIPCVNSTIELFCRETTIAPVTALSPAIDWSVTPATITNTVPGSAQTASLPRNASNLKLNGPNTAFNLNVKDAVASALTANRPWVGFALQNLNGTPHTYSQFTLYTLTLTVAQTPISLTATAQSSVSIKLTWSGSAGTLYRSTDKNFTPGNSTRIYSDPNKTSYTNVGLTEDTTYYYILVPSSPDYKQSNTAHDKTPKGPRVTITEFTLNPEVTVGEPTQVKLTAELEGVTPDEGTVEWSWFKPEIKFREEEPKSPKDWSNTPFAESNLTIDNPNEKTTTQNWEFGSEGYYQVKVLVLVNFKVNGVLRTLYSVANNQDN